MATTRMTKNKAAPENDDSKVIAGVTSSDRRHSSETGVVPVDSPALIHRPFILMEELLEKLKLVKYDVEFCQPFRYKPISRHYFALATSPGEQFNYFVSLAAWLLRSCGRKMDQPQESDDPNATIAVILDSLRALQISYAFQQCKHFENRLRFDKVTKSNTGYKPDFPPSKLKSGCGEQCIWVLDCLAEHVLKVQQFMWEMPEYSVEQKEEVEIVDDCDSVTSECDRFSIMGHDDYDDDSDALGVDELRQLGSQLDAGAGDAADAVTREMLESNVDCNDWKLEVERMLPQLKLTAHAESKDWREHVDQLHQYSDAIESCMKDTRGQLERLSDDISRTLEKIASRERYLTDELHYQLNGLKSAHDRRAERKETYRQASVGLVDKSRYLAELGDELERVKQEIEERGNSMADGAPLVKIKQAITRTRQEVSQMDIRVGLLQHILLRQSLNAKLQLRDTAAAY